MSKSVDPIPSWVKPHPSSLWGPHLPPCLPPRPIHSWHCMEDPLGAQTLPCYLLLKSRCITWKKRGSQFLKLAYKTFQSLALTGSSLISQHASSFALRQQWMASVPLHIPFLEPLLLLGKSPSSFKTQLRYLHYFTLGAQEGLVLPVTALHSALWSYARVSVTPGEKGSFLSLLRLPPHIQLMCKSCQLYYWNTCIYSKSNHWLSPPLLSWSEPH